MQVWYFWRSLEIFWYFWRKSRYFGIFGAASAVSLLGCLYQATSQKKNENTHNRRQEALTRTQSPTRQTPTRCYISSDAV